MVNGDTELRIRVVLTTRSSVSALEEIRGKPTSVLIVGWSRGLVGRGLGGGLGGPGRLGLGGLGGRGSDLGGGVVGVGRLGLVVGRLGLGDGGGRGGSLPGGSRGRLGSVRGAVR